MSADVRARQLKFAGEAQPEVFVLDHPVDRIEPVDDEPEPACESATDAFLLWLKTVTHDGHTLCPKDEIAARVVSLIYLLEGGSKAIAQLAFESGIPHSKIHRRIQLLSKKTGLSIPNRKTARSLGGAS